ncbi:unnamed protein product [Brassica oleracea]
MKLLHGLALLFFFLLAAASCKAEEELLAKRTIHSHVVTLIF